MLTKVLALSHLSTHFVNMATVAHKKALQELTRAAQSPSDLFSLLNEAKLIDLQEFVVNQIKDMSSEKASSAYYRRAPMTNIFPDDLQQHILTFLNVNQNRTVCQRWHRLNQQNEENMIRTVCSMAETHPSSEIWILHQNRRTLIPVEERIGCKGTVNNLVSVKSKCPPGSLVLVHQGSYECDSSERELRSGNFIFRVPSPYPEAFNNISFLGVEGSTIVLHSEKFQKSGPVLFENLRIKIRGSNLRISNGAQVIFRNCTIDIQHRKEIVVERSGSLEVTDCSVNCNSRGKHWEKQLGGAIIPFRIDPSASKVTVEKSEFQGFGLCAAIYHGGTMRSALNSVVEIRICHNVFHGITGHAVVELAFGDTQQLIFGTERCTLSMNTNGTTGSEIDKKLNSLHLVPHSAPAPQPQVPFTFARPSTSTTNTTSHSSGRPVPFGS